LSLQIGEAEWSATSEVVAIFVPFIVISQKELDRTRKIVGMRDIGSGIKNGCNPRCLAAQFAARAVPTFYGEIAVVRADVPEEGLELSLVTNEEERTGRLFLELVGEDGHSESQEEAVVFIVVSAGHKQSHGCDYFGVRRALSVLSSTDASSLSSGTR